MRRANRPMVSACSPLLIVQQTNELGMHIGVSRDKRAWLRPRLFAFQMVHDSPASRTRIIPAAMSQGFKPYSQNPSKRPAAT